VVGKFLRGMILLLLPVSASTPAWAQGPAHAAVTPSASDPSEPILLTAVEEWQALALGSGLGRICYVAQARSPRSAFGKRDARATLYVTHRPARQAFDVVAFAAPYSFRRDSMARLAFTHGPSQRLFTDDKFAWAGDETNDRRIVRAMVESSAVTVTGLGLDGHLHEDTIGLEGFAAAFQRASSECRRPGPPIKR
jgi:hypothetical protein